MNQKNLNNEDLLKIISEETKASETELINNDIVNFVATFNISSGSFKITTLFLYKLYSYWSSKPVAHSIFTQDLATIVPISGKYAKISLNKSKITEHTVDIINKKTEKSLKHNFTGMKNKTENFIKHYSLENGDLLVNTKVLFYLLDKWLYKNNSKPITASNFTNILRLYFKNKKISDEYHFYINSSIYEHITKEEIEEIIKGTAKYEGKESFKKNQKANSKISKQTKSV